MKKLAAEKSAGESNPSTLFLELLLLTLLTLCCRLPFFFESVIDWDESTFILIGQSILDGHLPYTQLWDIKPPFAYGFFSLAILLFGKMIASVRFAGALVVALTAFVVNRITQRLWTIRSGWLAGVLMILITSVLKDGQAVMSEHLAVLPLVLALYVLVARGITTATLFFTALLISTAAMVRLNLAYVVVGVGLYLLALGLKQPLAKQIRSGLAYSLGGVIPVFVSIVPYWMAGIPQVWWNSVVVAALSRADSNLESYEVAWDLLGDVLVSFWSVSGFGLQVLFWGGAIAGTRLMFNQSAKMQPSQKLSWALVIVFLLTVLFSILSSGSGHSHYLFQIVPFLVILSGVFADTVISRGRRAIALLSLILCLGLYPVFKQYAVVLPRALTGSPLDQSPARQIADYFTDNGLADRSIYFMRQHIVHWYLGTYPLIPSIAHPSTIGKDYLLQALYGPDWS
ncbi:MAG: hypothetical protein WA949_15725, partial [Phormidesmis sp.]